MKGNKQLKKLVLDSYDPLMSFLKNGNLDSRKWKKKSTRLDASQFLKINMFLENREKVA
jgi:hypothetical protein